MQTAPRGLPGTIPPRQVRVLLVPADPAGQVQLMVVADSARAISDALGGCLLDDTTVGALPQGGWFTVYLADGVYLAEGDVATLPGNPRAAALVARLGLVGRQFQARIRGPVLIAGLDPDTGADVDVPVEVVAAAEQTGLTVTPAARRPGGPPPTPGMQ